ncbi:MAG: neutral/alkaline non-lysosomal ceramidase N-terminal domain-containing protein, partial [Bryobacteraceae bacterium]
NDTWVAGYSNDVFAYIPSVRVLKEGGYEGGGAMTGYGLPGPFAEGVEEAIAAQVDALVRATGPAA